MISAANGIEHRLIKPNHPWPNGEVGRMNRTIRDAPRKRFHSDTHEHLGTHLGDFIAACNYEQRHKSALEHYTAVRHVMIASQGNAWGKPPTYVKSCAGRDRNPHPGSCGPRGRIRRLSRR
jgi:hypothetical protein